MGLFSWGKKKEKEQIKEERKEGEGIREREDSREEHSNSGGKPVWFGKESQQAPKNKQNIPPEDAESHEEFKYLMKKGNNNIMVNVRCRPLTNREIRYTPEKCIKILNNNLVIVSNMSAEAPEEAFRGLRPKDKPFAFDYAFDEDATQDEVFVHSTKFLIEGLMEGFNATVFAYGPTGAGKTHTMLGPDDQNPGIMFNSIKELVGVIDSDQSFEYKMRLWYLEVYNENLKDLLNPIRKTHMDLREDPLKGVLVVGVTEIMVTGIDDIFRLLHFGNKNRTKENTWANDASSRAHAVLQVILERRPIANTDNSEVVMARLTLIDLAGSERASNTKNRGLRLKESQNINRSLLSLGNCITALCEQGKTNKVVHIPYRDSKLTRLLKDTLGGNCRTVMIANVSPSVLCYEDTMNTLKYADRAKQIKTIVQRNVLNVQTHISNYNHLINQLKVEITQLKKQVTEEKSKRVEDVKKAKDEKKQPKTEVKMYYPSDRIKKMQLKLNIHFQKETKTKKKIFEIEQGNVGMGFTLFQKQLNISKRQKSSGEKDTQDITKLRKEIEQIRRAMEEGTRKIKAHLQNLEKLEAEREDIKKQVEQEFFNNSIDKESFKYLFRNEVHNLLQLDYERNNAIASYHLKQRENYIEHLREELQQRDQIMFQQNLSADMIGNEDENYYSLIQAEKGVMILSSLPDLSKSPSANLLEGINPHLDFLSSARKSELTTHSPNSLPNIKRGNGMWFTKGKKNMYNQKGVIRREPTHLNHPGGYHPNSGTGRSSSTNVTPVNKAHYDLPGGKGKNQHMYYSHAPPNADQAKKNIHTTKKGIVYPKKNGKKPPPDDDIVGNFPLYMAKK